MTEILGGCYCGAIRYRLGGHHDAGLCYCDSCRKATGAHVVPWLVVEREDFELLSGEPARYVAPNGAVWSFCSQCGTTLSWERPNGPFTVTVGSLDSPADFPPTFSSWDEDRLPWEPAFAERQGRSGA